MPPSNPASGERRARRERALDPAAWPVEEMARLAAAEGSTVERARGVGRGPAVGTHCAA